MAESKEDPLDESERGKWKSWLETQQKTKIMAGIWSHHFMAMGGEKVETVTFSFLGL